MFGALLSNAFDAPAGKPDIQLRLIDIPPRRETDECRAEQTGKSRTRSERKARPVNRKRIALLVIVAVERGHPSQSLPEKSKLYSSVPWKSITAYSSRKQSQRSGIFPHNSKR